MSHTYFEDEQRLVHFEEWDRILDDHLNTIHALEAGVDPWADWVWDDVEYMSPLLRGFLEMKQEMAKIMKKLIDAVSPALQGMAEHFREFGRHLANIFTSVDDWRARDRHRTRSLAALAPTRTDMRNVTYTRTKPPKPSVVYRRRTP